MYYYHPDKVITNYSSFQSSNIEENFLPKGLKFALPPVPETSNVCDNKLFKNNKSVHGLSKKHYMICDSDMSSLWKKNVRSIKKNS